MGVGVSFLQPPKGVTPLLVEENGAFGFPSPWKKSGSVGALNNFWGVRT